MQQTTRLHAGDVPAGMTRIIAILEMATAGHRNVACRADAGQRGVVRGQKVRLSQQARLLQTGRSNVKGETIKQNDHHMEPYRRRTGLICSFRLVRIKRLVYFVALFLAHDTAAQENACSSRRLRPNPSVHQKRRPGKISQSCVPIYIQAARLITFGLASKT